MQSERLLKKEKIIKILNNILMEHTEMGEAIMTLLYEHCSSMSGSKE